MELKNVLCILLKVFVIFNYNSVFIDGASSTIGEHIKYTNFQTHSTANPQPQLSSAQQQQILNDVQQHQRHYSLSDASGLVTFPGQTHFSLQSDSTTAFPSLAKYKVDRTKQNHRQLDTSFLQTAHTQHQLSRRPIFTTTPINSFNSFQDLPSVAFQNPQNLNYFNDQTNLNLQTFYEKQRELELLRKQKEQLILEQQELRRQQELLRLEKLASATSTTPATTSRSTSTTLRATTPAIIDVSPTIPRITPAESDIFLKAIATHQKKFTTTIKPQTISITNNPTTPSLKEITINQTQDIPLDILSLIEAQNPHILDNNKKSKIKIIYQTEKPSQNQDKFVANGKNKSLEKDKLLRNLKLALAATSSDESEKNVTTRDLILPNGKKLQVIQAPNGLSSIIPNEGSSQFQTVTHALDSTAASSSMTTVKPVEAIFKELTEGVVPQNAEFEVLRQKDGKLEQVGQMPINNPLGKKVTFVVLEEQADGSYKVQGVKGNADHDSSTDVESIVEKIKKGEIQLPPNSKKSNPKITTKYSTVKSTIKPTTVQYSNITNSTQLWNSTSSNINYVTTKPNFSKTDDYQASSSTPVANFFNSVSPFDSTSPSITTAHEKPSSIFIQPQNRFNPTTTLASETFRPTSIQSQFFTTPRSYSRFTTNSGISIPSTSIRPTTISTINSAASENLIIDELHNNKNMESLDHAITHQDNSERETIASIFRREGLFAMAKYLRQSGLDTVLNETGPYTIFVPTDKAFRALLVQLGGPEKAEQKFRENPRLLSGLLLHHVIPGAFRMDSLQEEMTGVSLAGTQLRVNIYDMHDHEWNDVKVTTINGAKISPNKRDIEIPQGIAHTMDRVMFPLPVGDLMQTLAADREQRFKTFLKILHASGMEETLSGTKTFTIFAPTDEALASAAVQFGRPVWTEADNAEVAKTIASKHIMPTTLYTAGMRFYLQKDTLRPQFSLKIQKNGGKIRVNDAQVVTYNVPATNGVIHSIDNVL